MRDDDPPPENEASGRGRLVVAWSALLALLVGAFVYIFFLAPAGEALDRYGAVTVELGPPPPASPEPTEPSGRDESAPPPADEPDAVATSQPAGGKPDTSGPETGGEVPAAGRADEPDSEAATGTAPVAQAPATSPSPPQQTARAPATEQPPGAAPDTAGTAESPEPGPDPEPARPAWRRHAHGITPPPQGIPRIAVVVRGLGLSQAATQAAIDRLPAAISLSFTPYAREAADWTVRARSQRHEVLIDLPMEPESFPARDPGPKALMTTLPTPVNIDRLQWAVDKGHGVVGVVAQMGSRFLATPEVVAPVMQRLKQLGLMYVDNGELRDSAALAIARRIGLPHVANDRTLDGGQVSRPAIEARLVEAERIAQQDGLAVVMAHPFPVTIDLLAEWTRDLGDRGFVLVPITAAVSGSAKKEAASLR